jgi:uncharacterized protein (TIGR03437 family)
MQISGQSSGTCTFRCVALFVALSGAITAQNVITTIAGQDPSLTGNGQPAVNVPIGYVNGVATDGAGNVYFTDPLEHMVFRVSPDGTLTVVAGNGIAAYSGDGGPATSAAIAASGSLPLGTTLADATVLMAGNALPLLYGSSGQINAVVSSSINTNTSQQVIVQRGNTISIPISVDVAPAEPGLFRYPAPGDPPQQGAIVNAVTYAVADPAAPVTAGDVLAIFCTELGAVDRTIPDGAPAPSAPLANTGCYADGDHRRTKRAGGFFGIIAWVRWVVSD